MVLRWKEHKQSIYYPISASQQSVHCTFYESEMIFIAALWRWYKIWNHSKRRGHTSHFWMNWGGVLCQKKTPRTGQTTATQNTRGMQPSVPTPWHPPLKQNSSIGTTSQFRHIISSKCLWSAFLKNVTSASFLISYGKLVHNIAS